MTKSRIAILIAGLLAVPATVVALEQSASIEAMQQPAPEIVSVEQTVVAEPVAVVADVTPSGSYQSVGIVAEPVYVAETVVVQEPVPVASQPPVPTRHRFMDRFHHREGMTGTSQNIVGTTFPAGTYSEEWNLQARHAAYLAQQQQRASSITVATAFPAGSNGEDLWRSPRQITYVDQIESPRTVRLAMADSSSNR